MASVLSKGGERAAGELVQKAKTLAMQKRDAEAVAALREAIRLAPELQEAHCCLGVSLMGVAVGVDAGKDVDAARYDEAVAAFREAIRLKADDGRAHSHLGEALNILERHAEAVTALEEARRLDPAYFAAIPSLRRRLECSQLGRKWDGVR